MPALDPGLFRSAAQLGVAEGIVFGAAAAKEAGEGDDFVDDGEIGVKVGVLFDELREVLAALRRHVLDAADGEMRMKGALLFAIAELGLEGVVDGGLQLL